MTRAENPVGVVAKVPLRKSAGGGSGSFLLRADDERRYWCKTLNNFQHERVPANEQIVARLGLLVGAPVCEPQLVEIPEDLVGWEFREGGGRLLERGWAHGSLAVEPAVETRDLTSRATDDNARRHAGLYAIHDWLGGSDAQWLMVGSESVYYSHDHGHYFPGGPAWSIESLAQAASAASALSFPSAGLDDGELERLADRLEVVAEQEVAGCVSNLPTDWPVQDDELEALVDFVLNRRSSVAQRLRAMIGTV